MRKNQKASEVKTSLQEERRDVKTLLASTVEAAALRIPPDLQSQSADWKARVMQVVAGEEYLIRALRTKEGARSIVKCMSAVADAGLSYGGDRPDVWLCAKGGEFYNVISADGLIRRAMAVGAIKSVRVGIVKEKDDFGGIDAVDGRVLRHVMHGGERGKTLGIYAVVDMTDGSKRAEYASAKELQEHADNYGQRDKSGKLLFGWTKSFDQRASVVVVKRLLRWIKGFEEITAEEERIEKTVEGRAEDALDQVIEQGIAAAIASPAAIEAPPTEEEAASATRQAASATAVNDDREDLGL